VTHPLWRGEPIAVLIDEAAIGGSDRVRLLLDALGLQVIVVGAHSPTLVTPAVGIFGDHVAPMGGCHAWYVGPGPAPPWMRLTLGRGPATTIQILRMLGTALVQEQAAVAFRAAGAGLCAPTRIPLDPVVLRGVDRAVCPVHVRGPARPAADLDPESLLRKAFAAIEACCAPNGAIAAAPAAGPGQPDYWFFWQRDGAAAALALHALATAGPDDLRARAAALCGGYLEFVDRIGRGGAVAAGRVTMGAVPVGGYGDPQHDGPPATVLAVLTLDPTALAVARPFLEHLLLPGRRPGFDLWELIKGRSFHAENLRRRALRLAESVATDVDEALARRCRVTDERPVFVDPAGGWRHVLDPDPAWFKQTSRLDSSVLGSALLAFDGGGDIDHPCLAQTVRRLEEHYAIKWPVNLAWRRGGNAGAGIGRFPEDANDGFGSSGGNPWPVATLWMAQYHGHRGNRELAEGYLRFVTTHVDSDAISEQIDAVTGAPRGARGLVWAHAELVVTLLARVRRDRLRDSPDQFDGRGGAPS
jgi:hypothetical protein